MKQVDEILKEYLGKKVVVYLDDGGVCTGILSGVGQNEHGDIKDILLNDALYENSREKYKIRGMSAPNKKMLIRADYISYIQLNK